MMGDYFVSVATCPERGLVFSKLGGRLEGDRFVLTCKKPLKQKLNSHQEWEVELLKRTVRPEVGNPYVAPDHFKISPAVVGITDSEDELFHPVMLELRAQRTDDGYFNGRLYAPRVIRLIRCVAVPRKVLDVDRSNVWYRTEDFEDRAAWADRRSR